MKKRIGQGTFQKPSIIERWEYAKEKKGHYFEDNAALNFGYYKGTAHWRSEEMAKLAEEDRPATIINYIFKAINTLSGNEIQNRNDIYVFPFEGGDVRMADIANFAMKYVKKENNLDWRFSQANLDGFITGQGWLKNSVELLPGGDVAIKVRSRNPLSIAYDPGSIEIDLEDAHDVHEDMWMDVEEMAKRFPQVKDDIASFSRSAGKERASMYYDQDKNLGRAVYSEFKDYTKTNIVLVKDGGKTIWLPEKEAKKKKIIRKIPTIKTIVKGTWHYGSIELEAPVENPQGCGEGEFSYTPVFPYFVQGEGVAPVDQVRSIQDIVNKSYSQAVDILNRQPKVGGIYEKGAIKNPDTLNDMATSGTWTMVEDLNKVKMAPPPQYPQAHMAVVRDSIDLLKEVLSIPDVFIGEAPGRIESGLGVQILNKQAGLPFEMPADNLRLAQINVGRKIINQFSEFWSDDKFMRIMGSNDFTDIQISPDLIEISKLDKYTGKVKVDEDGRADIEVIPNKLKDSKFDFAIDVNTPSPTQRMANQAAALQIFQQMPRPEFIPLVIGMLDFPDKEKWLEATKQATQADALAAQGGQPIG